MGRKWAAQPQAGVLSSTDEFLAIIASAPSGATKEQRIPASYIPTFIGKTDLAVGYTLDGGVSQKTLTVTENSTIDQDLSFLSGPSFTGLTVRSGTGAENVVISNDDTNTNYLTSNGYHNFTGGNVKATWLDVGSGGALDTTKGIKIFETNPHYRIGFDNTVASGAIQYNIDLIADTHCHAFTAGEFGGVQNILACIRGDGRMSINDSAPESNLDVNGDVRIQDGAIPSDPTTGHKLYSSAGDLFARDNLGNVTNITSPPDLSKWNVSAPYIEPKPGQGVSGFRITDPTLTQNFTFFQGPTNCTYNTSNGIHIFNATVRATSVDVPSGGSLDSTKGVNFFGSNPNYRIGHDASFGGYASLRYNIDSPLNTHGHVWSAGILSGSPTVLAVLRGDGLMAIGDQQPQSWLDVKFDIRVGETTTPITPSAGIKVYSKTDGNLYALNSAGIESNLTSGATDSKWDNSSPGALFPKDALAVDRIFIKDAGMAQAFTIQNTGAEISYTNSSGGGHRFGGGDVSIGLQAPESNLDVASDIRVGEIVTPSNPTVGQKIYGKADGNLYTLNAAGLETNLTAAASDSKWQQTASALFPKDPLGVDTITLKNLAQTQSWFVNKTDTNAEYNNTNGIHDFLQGVKATYLDAGHISTLTTSNGINLFAGNNDYRIGFDNQGATVSWMRFNIDVAASTHNFTWTSGPITSAPNVIARLRGDGKFSVGSQDPESSIDVAEDIRVGEISTPSNPTSGIKIYSKTGTDLFALDTAGTETNLIDASSTSKWVYAGNNILPAPSPAVEGISIQDLAKTQAFTVLHNGTTVIYTNTYSGGPHSFVGGPVQADWYSLRNQGTLNAGKGISLFELNNDYKIGFDDNGGGNGWIRYNVDTLAATHGHVFTGGPLASSTILASINGLGDMSVSNDLSVGADAAVSNDLTVGADAVVTTSLTVGAQANESTIDSSGDIRLAEIASPSNPTSGVKVFAKTDNDVYARDSNGDEINLSRWNITNVNTSPYLTVASDNIISVDATTVSVTVIIDASVMRRPVVVVPKTIGAGKSVNIEPAVGQTINGSTATRVIAAPGSEFSTYTIVPISSTEMAISSIEPGP